MEQEKRKVYMGSEYVEVGDDVITRRLPLYELDEDGEPTVDDEGEYTVTGHHYVLVRSVGVYFVTRHIGGPEEGGWPYDTQEHELSIPLETPGNRQEFEEIVEFLKPKFKSDRELYKIGGYEYRMLPEYTRGERHTTARPQYS